MFLVARGCRRNRREWLRNHSNMTAGDKAAHHHEKFSLPLFLVTVGLTLAGIGVVFWRFAPEIWHGQWQASGAKFAAVFFGASLALCFVEFFFHRYVLHRPALPGLGRFYRQHTLHHGLTHIARKSDRKGRGVLFVENRYPIMEAEQGEASFFPWYSLTVFAAFMTPFLAALQWAVPSFPWFLGGYAALTTSLLLYELLHAIEHWPFEIWAPLIEHPRWGGFWRRVYSFHLRHHAVVDCNESVSGFFGLPVADWLFGTCVIPRTLYSDGEEWRPQNFVAPRPGRFIRRLDAWAARATQTRRERARHHQRTASAPPRDYTRGEEIANWLTHGLGAVLSGVGLTLLVWFANERGDTWHVVSFTVFGLSLLVLYAMSTLYHLSRTERRRWLFKRLDHAAIFLLIAGTYTPFLLTNLRGPWGWSLFGVIWGICGAGAIFEVLHCGRNRFVSVLAYLFAGWLIVVAAKPLLGSVPHGGLWLLLAGGLCYTIGVVFYLWHRLRYHHAVWHGFVLGGSACHYFAVLLFLLPPATR